VFEGANTRGAQLFFSLYFGMTGLHASHMVVGIIVMIPILLRAMKGGYTPDYYTPVEMFGLYWHFVDIVWIFLFPLLYLLGGHLTTGGGHH
jgi:cytochrome c oxidase subunit 3